MSRLGGFAHSVVEPPLLHPLTGQVHTRWVAGMLELASTTSSLREGKTRLLSTPWVAAAKVPRLTHCQRLRETTTKHCAAHGAGVLRVRTCRSVQVVEVLKSVFQVPLFLSSRRKYAAWGTRTTGTASAAQGATPCLFAYKSVAFSWRFFSS